MDKFDYAFDFDVYFSIFVVDSLRLTQFGFGLLHGLH